MLVQSYVAKQAKHCVKLSVSLTTAGIASVDHISWDAFNEGGDLPVQVEAHN